MRGVLFFKLAKEVSGVFLTNPNSKVTPKVPKGGVQSSCAHTPGCLPHVVADPKVEVGKQRKQETNSEQLGPAGSMSRDFHPDIGIDLVGHF